MIATEMAIVAPMVMTTAAVSWKEAMVPTMYDKLRVTTTCRHITQSMKSLHYSLRKLFSIVCGIDSQVQLMQIVGI